MASRISNLAALLPSLLLLLTTTTVLVCEGRDDTCRLLCISCERSRIVYAAQCPNSTCDCLQTPQAQKAPEQPEDQPEEQPEPYCPMVDWLNYTFCPYGFARDAKGCPTRSCSQPSPACQPADAWRQRCGSSFCPNGWRLDESGCPTCDCVGCPAVVNPPVCPPNSSIRCEQLLTNGCYGNCSCVPACPKSPECSNDCGVLGYETDNAGCRLSCACRCPKDKCPDGECSGGYATDRYGCRYCKLCVSAKSNPWWCFNDPPVCNVTCGAGGFKRGEDGCRTGCECQCPALPDSCPTECQWGRVKDSNGCDACECASLSHYQETLGCSMPEWLYESCSHLCNRRYGNRRLRLDRRGCPECRCCGRGRLCSRRMCASAMSKAVAHNGCPMCYCPLIEADTY